MGKFEGKNPRCSAMIEGKITDPNSQEGINFCVDECPYPHCVIAEPTVTKQEMSALEKKRRARAFQRRGFTIREISIRMGVKAATVRTYLERVE
jgi:hypothetical protein